VTLSTEETKAGLLRMRGVQAPDANRGIVRSRGNDKRIDWRRGEVIDLLQGTSEPGMLAATK